MKKSTRNALIGGGLLLAAAYVARRVLDGRRRSGVTTSRISRSAQLAMMSARSAGTYATAQARAALAPPERRAAIREEAHLRSAEQVLETLGNMKGAVMKLAQFMSFAAEGMPAQYRELLTSLQSQAPAMDYVLVEQVIAEELGGPPLRVFRSFSTEPKAAASIGQVHRAELADGTPVAVKVQYPGVADAIKADLSNASFLFSAVGMLSPGLEPEPIVAELKERVIEELDYLREAGNQGAFLDVYRGHPFIVIPEVHPASSTARVLTMDWLEGSPFSSADALPQDERDLVGEKLYRFVFGSLYSYGFFNGDPHPGNYLLMDGGRVGFLDFGCVKRFRPEAIAGMRRMMRAAVDGDPAAFREVIADLGFIRPDCPVSDEDLFEHFELFYKPSRVDEEFTYTHAYATECIARLFDPSHPMSHVQRQLTMPGDWAILQRINLGLNSILASLEATANWYRIAREYWDGMPPSTPLGEAAAAYHPSPGAL